MVNSREPSLRGSSRCRRQGTARFSAKLQQEAERTLTHAVIYHAVQSAGQGDPAKAEALREQIKELEPIAAGLPVLQTVVETLRRELAEAEGGVTVHLDQGLGSWRRAGHRPVPFDGQATVAAQVAALAKVRTDVEMQDSGATPSPVWATWCST